MGTKKPVAVNNRPDRLWT